MSSQRIGNIEYWNDYEGVPIAKTSVRQFGEVLVEGECWNHEYKYATKLHQLWWSTFGVTMVWKIRPLVRISFQPTRFAHSIFRADGEFVTSELRKFGEQHGITFEFTCGHSSFQNGSAERIIRTISEMGLSMLFHSGLGVVWWPEFILTASYILNRVPHSSLEGKTPFEFWKHHPPNVPCFRVYHLRLIVII